MDETNQPTKSRESDLNIGVTDLSINLDRSMTLPSAGRS
jgi:hypothetical protein